MNLLPQILADHFAKKRRDEEALAASLAAAAKAAEDANADQLRVEARRLQGEFTAMGFKVSTSISTGRPYTKATFHATSPRGILFRVLVHVTGGYSVYVET